MTEHLSYEELWLIAFVKTHLAEVTVGFVILWSAHLRGLKRLATEGSESLERSEDSARARWRVAGLDSRRSARSAR